MAMVSVLRHSGSAALAIVLAAGWCAAAPAQNPPVPSSSSGATIQPSTKSVGPANHPARSAKNSKRNHLTKPEPETAITPTAPIRPPDPPPPDWPVNDKAAPATVNWDGRDLVIAATNSSLQQILSDVSTATGVKVEGDEADQRIYGSYGPAPARDVLGKLLEGSGYNVLMIGDQGEGTPRELVLTTKAHTASAPAGNAQAKPNSDEDAPDDPEPPEQQQPPQSLPGQRRPFGMPGQQRNPEQIMQEQIRQQQLQQQQTGQPPVPPQPQPPPNE